MSTFDLFLRLFVSGVLVAALIGFVFFDVSLLRLGLAVLGWSIVMASTGLSKTNR